ncbi:MAG: PLP-dependent aminotransferase family protein [Spirochaetaceae bacterium]|nr:PLP-dependent aminotransferase family protein [Spirochaetaceae bacterium]
MFTCDFSKRGNLTLSDFLYENLKSHILAKDFKPNEKLPSKRNLANHLGISVITVANTYERLISEGYIYSIEKSGFYVTELLTFASKDEKAKSQDSKIDLDFENPIFPKKAEIDFKTNAISFEKFPFKTWNKITKEVFVESPEHLLKLPEAKGVFQLRKEIALYLRRFRNMKVSPNQIVIGSGTEYLYSLLVKLFDNNLLYAVENPGYKKIAQVLKTNGVKCKPCNLDDFGLSIEDLEKSGANVVHLSPSHHFPTGIVMPVRRRQEILSWANREKNRYIIEDDYDSEFRFLGKPLTPLFSSEYNTENKVIYINTFTKSLSPSFRIGYLVLPKNLLEVFEEKLGFFSNTVSSFEQFVLAKFMEKGFFEKHIIKMKNYYRSLRNYLIFCLEKSSLSNFCKIKEEEAGLHFLLEIDKKIDSETLKKDFSKNNIVIPFLEDYFYGEKTNLEKIILVINYSGIKKEDIPKSVKKLEVLLSKY